MWEVDPRADTAHGAESADYALNKPSKGRVEVASASEMTAVEKKNRKTNFVIGCWSDRHQRKLAVTKITFVKESILWWYSFDVP